MLRIQRSSNQGVVFSLSGRIELEDIAELQRLLSLEAVDQGITLDLEDITLVDRDAVKFLARCEAVMLTTYEGDVGIQQALESGARGYLLKSMPPKELVEGIRQVHAGKKCIVKKGEPRPAQTKSFRSTKATVIAAHVSLPANDGPACPAPMMIASNFFTVMKLQSAVLQQWRLRPQ